MSPPNKPTVRLKGNKLTIRLPPSMHYIADAMEIMIPASLHKFAIHAAKGDWIASGYSVDDAMHHLSLEIEELAGAVASGRPEDVMMEAGDVLNLAIIIGTLFKHQVAPEKIPFEWYGRSFVARSDGEIEYGDGLRAGQLVKFNPNKKGYYTSNVYGVDTPRGYKAMARAATILRVFKGPPPEDNYHCDHQNELNWDDRPDNLQWLHPSENSAQSGRRHLGAGRGWSYHKDHPKPYRVTLRGKYVGCYLTQEEAEEAHAAELQSIRSSAVDYSRGPKQELSEGNGVTRPTTRQPSRESEEPYGFHDRD